MGVPNKSGGPKKSRGDPNSYGGHKKLQFAAYGQFVLVYTANGRSLVDNFSLNKQFRGKGWGNE